MTLSKSPTPEHLELQREFFRIDAATVARVQRLKPRILGYAAETLETLFDHLTSNPEVGDYFEISDNTRYLRDGMLAHCELVFSARFDAKYYEAVDQMGLRHSKLDYPSHAYSSAYANLMSGIMRLGLEADRKLDAEDLSAITRISIYDMELTIAAFFRHQLDKQAALYADTEKVREMMTERRLAS
ncbi:protoglobin domain-containing protein [Maricaulis sp.]|uniref:protoglobin domain-containing protein n=1 Tax=Maricaulis sp. TaxID=1486257 RepID=UPI003A93865B|tara:strand:+ start:103 stop:660 length:558 start_codon:yes stop_codon:yes gene_type:complete